MRAELRSLLLVLGISAESSVKYLRSHRCSPLDIFLIKSDGNYLVSFDYNQNKVFLYLKHRLRIATLVSSASQMFAYIFYKVAVIALCDFNKLPVAPNYLH